MTASIELQVISRLLTSESPSEVDRLCSYDTSYYSVYSKEIEFILSHKDKYGDVPDPFTFTAQFPEIQLITVEEPLEYLEEGLRKNKQHILFLETFNKLTDLGSSDVTEAWAYLATQCEKASELDSNQPMNIVKDVQKRMDQVIEFNRQKRIPTGFPEIDEAMYGGLSTVEELLIIIARTNTGKSWVCTKMMESAQLAGFPVLYYSPEMQASFIGTRFDTWRGHFKNSELFRGQYSAEYIEYTKKLIQQETGAFVVEDSDMPDNTTTVRGLETLVKKHNIKLLIIDGLSYISDGTANISTKDTSMRYKRICENLMKLSKMYRCAVVVAMQANRETKENKDEKGQPFPTIYNAEGSDHPARIATQVFSLRQIYDNHTLELRMEKSRSAKNANEVFAYIWDPNTGTTEAVDENSVAPSAAVVEQPSTSPMASFQMKSAVGNKISKTPVADMEYQDDDDDPEVEF